MSKPTPPVYKTQNWPDYNAALKVLFGMVLRQTIGLVESLLLIGLDWPVPDFSTLCRRQKRRFQEATAPFDPLSGIASHNPAGQWMHFVKLLGQRLFARDFDRQIAEV